MKKKLLISSCLIGQNVKYDGLNNKLPIETLNTLNKKYFLIPFCPEVEGGLPTPRIPCEVISFDPLKIVNKNKEDKTREFLRGATKTLQLCIEKETSLALLKANSPSCGNKQIYDGTFSGIKIDAMGVTAKLLSENKFTIFNEKEIDKLI